MVCGGQTLKYLLVPPFTCPILTSEGVFKMGPPQPHQTVVGFAVLNNLIQAIFVYKVL